MTSNMTQFSNAVYHRKEKYDFELTEFTRRELKVILLADGKRTVDEISALLGTTPYSLLPDFANLVRLNLMQTEGGIMSSDAADLLFTSSVNPHVEFTLARLPEAV